MVRIVDHKEAVEWVLGDTIQNFTVNCAKKYMFSEVADATAVDGQWPQQIVQAPSGDQPDGIVHYAGASTLLNGSLAIMGHVVCMENVIVMRFLRAFVALCVFLIDTLVVGIE